MLGFAVRDKQKQASAIKRDVDENPYIQPGLLAVFRVLTLFWMVAEIAGLMLDMVDSNIPFEFMPYLLFNLSDRFLLLAYLFIPGLPRRLGYWYLPLGIAIAAIGPFLANQLFIMYAAPALPARSVVHIDVGNTMVAIIGKDSLISRPSISILSLINRESIPSIYLPLILTAWQYRMRGVVLFCAAYAVITYFIPVDFFFRGQGLAEAILITIVRTASLATIGYLVARLITEQQKQREALSRANAKLTYYAVTMEQLTASRERNRLAHELHDTLAHTQSALAVQLEGVRSLWDSEPDGALDMLHKSINNTRSGLEETRRALRALRASPLEEMGLALALENQLQQSAARGNLDLTLRITDKLGDLTPDIEQCIYRIAQEAMENVIRHADATHVDVTLEQEGDKVSFILKDNGIGFDPDTVDTDHTFGLMGIRERAEVVGGTAVIRSEIKQGTVVQFEVEV